MSLSKVAQNIFTKLCNIGIDDRAGFLKTITVIGFGLSTLAQTFAIIFNKDIPKKEKKYLIPHEIFDGLINATLFWFVTSNAVKIGQNLVLKKRIIPNTLAKILDNFNPANFNKNELKDAFISHIEKNGKLSDVATAKNVYDGVGVLAGLGGAIVSSNILTPLVRNRLASICQKKELRKISPIQSVTKLSAAPKIALYNNFYTVKI